MDRNLTTEPAKEKDANTLIIFPNIKWLNTVFAMAETETNFRHEWKELTHKNKVLKSENSEQSFWPLQDEQQFKVF
jgi:hypothetical protein